MLMGRYEYTLDAKGRLNFPPKFREEMGELIFVTQWFDGCLVAMSKDQMDKFDDSISALPKAKSRELKRIFFGNATEQVPDKQGRILLPAHLRDYANITKDVVVLGTDDYAEIWDRTTLENRELSVDFDAIQAELEEMGF